MSENLRHPSALVESESIGPGTQIRAFCHILPGARIGADCNIWDGVFIENDVVIGDRVTVQCGVQLSTAVTIEDDVIGPNATFSNDSHTKHHRHPGSVARILVKSRASIGAHTTVLPGITIGSNSGVGAGAVVTRDVPPNAIVSGNPAHISGYVDTPSAGRLTPLSTQPTQNLRSLNVSGASLNQMPLVEDLRGALSFGEIGKHLPFAPKRYFLIYDVPNREVRGAHAHKESHQFVLCLRGSCAFVLDDGSAREEVVLDSPLVGLHIPPRVWRTNYKFTSNAVMLALASDLYLADDYIRDYEEFLRFVKGDSRGSAP